MERKQKSFVSHSIFSAFFAIAAVAGASLMAGCPPINTGGNQPKSSSNSSTSTGPGAGFSPAPSDSANALSIINAMAYSGDASTPPAPGAGPSPAPAPSASASSSAGSTTNVVLYFNSSTSTGTNVNSVCTASDGDMPCVCRFSWQEINPSTGSGYTRTVETSVLQPFPYMLTCSAPSVWSTEIPDGTTVNVSVRPDTRNGSTASFSSNTYQLIKRSTATDTGDFRDGEGRAIKNVLHYVCYDYDSKQLSISHAQLPGSTSGRTSGGSPITPPNVDLANKFRASNTDFSAQSYWYDFYVRSDEVGSINSSIPGFACPKVPVAKGTAPAVEQFFPLDSTFALALQRSNTYNVPVSANITLNGAGGGAAAVSGAIGYAAKPNSDGTCPAFADSLGLTRRTFRLRRYVVTYPLRYNADGRLRDTTQRFNTVYVLDRPVDRTGQDPLKPLTRLGPKPCPGSYNMNQSFNEDGTMISVAGTSTAGYVTHSCMVGDSKLPYTFGNDHAQDAAAPLSNGGNFGTYNWAYGLPDGKKFGLTSHSSSGAVRGSARTFCLPNGTSSGRALVDNLTETCSAAAPDTSSTYVDDFVTPKNLDGTILAASECPIYPPPAANLTTRGALVIRPVKGVVPEFLEDTSFEACAFQSSSPVDPDIVVAYNNYQYPQPGDRATDNPQQARAFYCARTYPDPAWMVRPSTGSTFTKPPGNCDSGRPHGVDAVNSAYRVPKLSNGSSDGYVNLTSTPSRRTVPDGVVSAYAIMNERSYACAFTYNPALSKQYSPNLSLTELVTPRSGCCQRCAGPSKSAPCSRAAPSANATNRGIHSLVDPTGPWYNRYGKPAFQMQSVLLSSAPYQLIPNNGVPDSSNIAVYQATGVLAAAYQSTDNLAGHAIVSGTWASEVQSTNSSLGCYDPSEDP